MVITFPVLISETVDKEMLPYLIKAVERRVALDYSSLIEKDIRSKLDKMHIESITTKLMNYDLQPTLRLHLNEDRPMLQEDVGSYGTQIIDNVESNKLLNDQPYFITIRVTTTSKVVQDFTFGFKGLSLVSKDALEIFEKNLDSSRYWIYRKARQLLSDKNVWKLVSIYKKMFGDKEDPRMVYTEKVLFSENVERICILSTNDINRETFEYSKKEDVPLSVGNLKRSQFSTLYVDDSLNKRIYCWDQDDIKFASIITYDMIYKNTLNVLPEQIDKAKQRNTSLFSKRAPTSFAFKNMFGKRG